MTPTTIRPGRTLAVNGVGVVYIGGMALANWAGLLEQSTMLLGIGVGTVWAIAGLYFLDRVVRQPRAFINRILIAVVVALVLGAIARTVQLDGKVTAAIMLAAVGFTASLGAIIYPAQMVKEVD